jgi:hypothetical protein
MGMFTVCLVPKWLLLLLLLLLLLFIIILQSILVQPLDNELVNNTA